MDFIYQDYLNIRILNILFVLIELFPIPDLLDWKIPYIYIYIYILEELRTRSILIVSAVHDDVDTSVKESIYVLSVWLLIQDPVRRFECPSKKLSAVDITLVWLGLGFMPYQSV